MEKKIRIPFLAGAKYKNMIYFSALYTNGLYRFDCNTNEIICIMPFEGEKIANCLYRKAILYQDDIWFMPYEAEKIAKYNIKENTMSYYEINRQKHGLAYFDAMIKDNMIIFIPYNYEVPIAVIEAQKEKVEFVDITKCKNSEIIAGLGRSKGWLVVFQSGSVVELSKTLKNEIVNHNENKKAGYLSSIDCDDYLWLIPYEAEKLVAFDKTKNVEEYICDIGENKYSYGMELNENVVIFPTSYNRDFLAIDKKSHNVNHIPSRIECDKNEYLEMIEMGNDSLLTYCIATNLGQVLEYDENWKLISSFQIEMDLKDYENITKKIVSADMFEASKGLKENNCFGLSLFLKTLQK